MPKPERGSLSMLKRALPNLPPAAPNAGLEAKILAGEGAGSGTAAVQQLDVSEPSPATPAPEPATRLVPRPGQRKEPVQMVTYRIPASLYDRLIRIAAYNNLNMTDIVVEAIERHLPNFPQPG